MSLRGFSFMALLGVAVVGLATANINCTELLKALNDGGTDGGALTDGGAATDGGGAGGSVTITMSCASGVTCNQAGNIIATVKPCGAGTTPIATDTSLMSQTLIDGTPLTLTISNVAAGSHCVDVYLDVNADSTPNTGDVVAASGEVPVTVTAGADSPATVNLDTIQQ